MSKLCSEMAVLPGCLTDAAGLKTDIAIHYEYRFSAAGERTLHKTRYTSPAGVPFAAAATDFVTVGQCPIAQPDVEFETLCDTSTAGIVTEFIRRTVTVFSATNVPTTTVSNLGLDYTTAYTPTGTVGACNQDCDVVAPVGLVATWS